MVHREREGDRTTRRRIPVLGLYLIHLIQRKFYWVFFPSRVSQDKYCVYLMIAFISVILESAYATVVNLDSKLMISSLSYEFLTWY